MDEFNEAMQLVQQALQILETKWDGRRYPMERVVLLKLEEALNKMMNVDNLYKQIAAEVRRIGRE
jgi:hypothetical protein